MALKITALDDKLIHCGDWTFDRKFGYEIDEYLGWGKDGTGSWITKP